MQRLEPMRVPVKHILHGQGIEAAIAVQPLLHFRKDARRNVQVIIRHVRAIVIPMLFVGRNGENIAHDLFALAQFALNPNVVAQNALHQENHLIKQMRVRFHPHRHGISFHANLGSDDL